MAAGPNAAGRGDRALLDRPEALVYQFIVTAVPANDAGETVVSVPAEATAAAQAALTARLADAHAGRDHHADRGYRHPCARSVRADCDAGKLGAGVAACERTKAAGSGAIGPGR